MFVRGFIDWIRRRKQEARDKIIRERELQEQKAREYTALQLAVQTEMEKFNKAVVTLRDLCHEVTVERIMRS